MIGDDCASNKIVGHVPLNQIKLFPNFFSLQIITLVIVATGKRVNRGVRLGLEIPVNYFPMEMQEM